MIRHYRSLFLVYNFLKNDIFEFMTEIDARLSKTL